MDKLIGLNNKRRGVPSSAKRAPKNATLNLSGNQPQVASPQQERLYYTTPFFDSLVDKRGFQTTNTLIRDAMSPKPAKAAQEYNEVGGGNEE